MKEELACLLIVFNEALKKFKRNKRKKERKKRKERKEKRRVA